MVFLQGAVRDLEESSLSSYCVKVIDQRGALAVGAEASGTMEGLRDAVCQLPRLLDVNAPLCLTTCWGWPWLLWPATHISAARPSQTMSCCILWINQEVYKYFRLSRDLSLWVHTDKPIMAVSIPKCNLRSGWSHILGPYYFCQLSPTRTLSSGNGLKCILLILYLYRSVSD